MKTYKANWLIKNHNGKDIQPGEIVSMPDDEADPLIACGALTAEETSENGVSTI